MQSTQVSTNTLQRKLWKEWLALLFILPIYVYPAIRYFSTGGVFSLRDIFIYSGAICGFEIIVILFLQRYLIGVGFQP